ncbi:tetratricopeptide repeat protein [Prochlorococcus marinus]|nr:tetratricopeptide repeat protein [Prochlorococcus marinus]
MFKGLQAASARFNLRSTMDRLNGKMGAGSGNVLDATMASKDIIKGLLIDLTFLVDTWNPEVKDLPPEKVIRDFNVFLFSGKYDLFVTDTLANTISHLDDKKIETFSSLLNYYFSAYGEKDCKEKKIIQNFVNQIIKGLERQPRDSKTGQGFLKDFINNQTTKWSLDDDLTQKEIEEAINEALNKRNNNALAIIGSVNKKIELKQFQEGIIQANKGLEIHKDNLLLYVARARCFYESGYMESAINDFTKSIELDNDLNNSIFHKYRGLAKLQINDKEGAFNDFKIAAGRGNDDAKELLNIYFKNKDNLSSGSTQKDSSMGVDGTNKNFNEFLNLAREQIKNNDNTNAINNLKKALKLSPNKQGIINCYFGLGIAKQKIKDFSGSIAAFTSAIDMDENDPTYTYLCRANTKYESEDFLGAISDYDIVLEKNPTEYSIAFYNRANAKLAINDSEGAFKDMNKSADLGNESAKDVLKRINSISNETKNNLTNEDESEKSVDNVEKKPIRRDAIQNVLETKLDNFNPTFKTWATFKALKRLAWVMEDDATDENEKDFYSFLLSSYKDVSSPENFTKWMRDLLYDKSFANDDPEWLESEWNIGPDSELHAFNSKESFLKSFDSEYTYSIFSKCWEIACSEDLYKLNDYESWSKKKYWFFKNKIWIITAEQVNKYYFKNDVLNKFLDSSQLESFFNYKIGNGISVLEVNGVKEVGEKLNYMDKTDLIKFHELPVELLENLATRPISKEDSELDFDYVEGNDTLGILPGGYYWIGDPINIQGNFRNKLNDSSNGGCFYSKNGMPFAFFETALGDGVFEDQKSNQYLVDSGQIACIPMEKVPEELDELGHIFHITNPFVCQYIDNGGFICFGEIVIKTDINNECSFPEPLKIEELGALNYGKYLYENDCGKADTWSKWASTIANEEIEDQSFKAAVEIYAKVKKSEISSESAFNLIVDTYGEKCSSGSFMAIYSSLDNQSKSKEIDLSDAVSTQKDAVMEFLNKHYSKEYIQEIINDKNKTNKEIEEYLFAIWLERNNSLVKKLSAWVEHKVFVHKNS